MKFAVILVIIIKVFNIYAIGGSRGSHGYGKWRKASKNGQTSESSADNPCNYTTLQKPDFSAPERRISEVSFLWKISQPGHPKHHAVGGRITKPGEFPHMGALGWRAAIGTWIFKCGSLLVSSKFLLTAAHCSQVPSRDTSVANSRPEIVRLGDKNIIDGFVNRLPPNDAKIKRIINHPNFNPPKKYFDIAIIEVTEDVKFTKYIQPACLWGHFDTRPLGNKATLTGWGVVETAGRKTSPELQAAVVDILDSNQCDHLLQPYFNRLWCGLESHQLCSGNLTGGVDACQGDSGGPLQVKIPLQVTSQGSMHYVIGVTSFGIGCALPNLPGIYTRVSSFIDWIEDVVWRGL